MVDDLEERGVSGRTLDSFEGEELIELGHVPTMGSYLREIWSRRDFAIRVPINDIRVQHIDTVLGQFWQLLNPAITVGVYFFIFGYLLDGRINRGVENYLGFLVIGVMLHGLLARVLSNSVRVIHSNEGLIRSVQFPRAILPISNVILEFLSFLPSVLVLAVALILTGESPQPTWILFPILVVGFGIFLVGVSLIGARAGASVRDLSNIVPHVMRMLFYLSGVLFVVETFVENEQVLRLFSLNPLYVYIKVARAALMDGQTYTSADVISLVVWTVVLPIVGLIFFARAENQYGS